MSRKNACSGCVVGGDYGANYSQTIRGQPQTTSDGVHLAERSQVYSSPYGVESDTSTTMSGSVGQAPGSQTNSTPSTGGHFYHRGLQQSPAFNPLLSSQGQPLYNGMYGTQGGYTSQNSFSSTGYNNYGHVEPPWISETRSVSSVLQQIEGDRSNRTQFIDKGLPCNAQNLSHTCCGSRLGIAESINMCSPLSTEAFRNINKEITNLQTKTNNGLDNQSWFCSQAMLGYGNQQNQNSQQTNYKCNEQYPSCSVSQMNMLLHDQADLKHPVDSSLTNSCFDTSQNHNSNTNKSIEQCSNNSVKSVCVEQNKDQSMKYCSLQKLQQSGQSIDHITLSVQQKHHQDQNGYVNHSMYSSTGELHDDVLYSQASMILHMGTDGSQNAPRFQPPFISSKHSLSQNNMSDIGKSYTVSPVLQHFQEHGRCVLDQSLSCEVVESCLQSDIKSANETIANIQNSVSTSNSCCQMSIEPTNNLSQENHSMFSTHLHSQRSNVNSLPNCSVVGDNMQICSNAATASQLPIECSKADSKEECSSVAGESDIIVEETEEEMSESEISIEEIKGTVFREESARCLVCSTVASSQTSDNQFVHMRGDSPVTSASHIPVVAKLAEVVADNQTQILKLNNEFICRRCFNLIDTVDCLETKLAAVKQDLIQLFETRLISLKALENWKVNQDVTDKAVEDTKDKVKTPISDSIVENTPLNEFENESDKCNDSENVLEEKSNDEFCDSTEKKEVVLDDAKCVGEEVKSDSICLEKSLISEDAVDESQLSSNKFGCEICSKLFSNKEYLNKHHQQQHTKQFSFYCDRCGKGFTFKRALENHLLLHSGEFRYQCEVCGKLFIQHYSLDDHLRKHQGQFRLTCQLCEKGFNSRNSLRIHMRTHTGERPFVCQHCGKRFSFSSNLVAHVRICSGDLPFSCSQCDKSFALETRLKTHVLSKHEGQYRFKCTVCGKGFTKDSDRKIHARSHSGEKPHKCSVCGKCYSSLGNLNQHAKQHGGERPFKCLVCSQGFLRRSTLAAHMNLHTGARPYNCDQCNKTFAAKRNLHAHKKLHEGTIKRYTCSVCGKIFNHGLQVHMRTHSGIKPYSCSDCGMAFTVRSTLNKHIKSKHQKIVQFEKQS